MINVTCGFYDNRLYLEIKGHALSETSESGGEQALVCAAASMLVCTCAERMRVLDSEGAFISAEIEVDNGYCFVDIEFREEYRQELYGVYSYLETGFTLLEENYDALVAMN